MKVKLKDFLLSACWNKKNRAGRMEDAKRQLDTLEKYIKPGKVFDVGAASGFFMKAAKERGWKPHGNDISIAGVKWAKENFDLAIHHDFFEDIDLPVNEYDAVVLWNTLEHTHNPAQTIKVAKQILKLNGFIYIKVPETRTVELLRKYYEPMHFFEFNLNNLVRHLRSQGFVEKEIYKEWERNDISHTEYLFQLEEKGDL